MKRPRSSISKKGIDEIISTEHISEEEIKAISDEIKKKQERLHYLYETGAVSDQSIEEKIKAFFEEKQIKEKFEKIFENIEVISKSELLKKLGGNEEYNILIYGEDDKIQFSLYDYVLHFLVLSENDPVRKVKFRRDIDNFKSDIIYYEEDTPFSDTLIRKGTKQEFIDRMNEIIKSEEDRKALFVKSQKESEKLKAMGYNVSGDTVSQSAFSYKERFVKVLNSNQIENIKQIPEKLNEQKTSSALQLFSNMTGLAKVEYKDDIHACEILKLIDEFTQRIKYEYLNERDFEKIFKIFILGHVDDTELFYKFEKLKEQNIKNQYQRFYLYGKGSADMKCRKIKGKLVIKVDKESLIETKYIDDRTMGHISFFLKNKLGQISDLEKDESKFWKKIERSYKYALKSTLYAIDGLNDLYDFYSLLPCENEFEKLSDEDKMLFKENIKNIVYIGGNNGKYFDEMLDNERNFIVWHFLNNNKSINEKELEEDSKLKNERYKIRYRDYMGYNSHNMQNNLGIKRQQLTIRMNESKKEFVDELPNLFEKTTFRGLITGTFDKEIYLSNYIFLHFDNLRERIKTAFDYYNLDLSSLRKKIINHIKNCMKEGIDFIKNKEECVHKTRPWSKRREEQSVIQKRKTITYQDQIKKIVNIIDILYNNLKTLDYSDEMTNDWEINKEKYTQEYFDGRKQIFVEKKIKEILTMEGFDINQRDEMRKKMIKNGKEKFMHESIKYISNKILDSGNETPVYSPMKNYFIVKMVNEVLFYLGYWTLLKQIIPDDKERKIERQNIVRTITENCLKEIGPKLANSKKFNDKEYYLLEPLIYLLKKYGGKIGDFKIKHKQIKQNYFEFVKNRMDNNVQTYFDKINKFISNPDKDKKSVESVYNYTRKISIFVFDYISQFIKKNNIELKGYQIDDISGKMSTYFKNNSEYLGNYAQDQINAFSFWYYSIPELEKILPLEINHSIKDVFHRLDKIKPQIWKGILSYRFRENAIPGGKLNRVVNEVLFEKFGLINVANQEQIDYAINYLEKNLIEIVLQDIKLFIFDGWECFESEKEIIKGFLNDFIFNWKERLSQKRQLGNRNQELGTGN